MKRTKIKSGKSSPFKLMTTIMLFAANMILVDCGAMSGKSSDEPDNSPRGLMLTGNWKNSCSTRNWLAKSVSYQSTRNFGLPSSFVHETTVFNDGTCTTGDVIIREEGNYQDLGGSAKVDGARDVNFTLTGASLKPLSDNAVKFLNDASYCDIKDWQKDKASDILGHNCIGANHPKGEVQFDIYRLDNNDNRLRTGNTSFFLDKGDANSRPKSLDDAQSYNRI